MKKKEKGFEKKLNRRGKIGKKKVTAAEAKGRKPAGISFMLPGILILLLAAVLAGSGCAAYECEAGSGNVVSETRSVEPFHSVDSGITGDIFIEQGSGAGLEIEAEDNLLPLLETDVENGVLVIRAEKCIRPRKPIKVYAGMDEVRSLSLSGSGDIKGTTPIDSENLKLAIIGSGDIELEVNAASLNTRISGSGDVFLEGSASSHDIEIEGSGDIEAPGFRTEITAVRIEGSGDAKVYTDRKLDIEILGSGNVFYGGSPEELNTRIAGSGKIEKVDEDK